MIYSLPPPVPPNPPIRRRGRASGGLKKRLFLLVRVN